MTEATPLREIANFAAIGWRWAETIPGLGTNEYEVTWIRGTRSIRFGSKEGPTDRWHTTSIDNPERFGFDGTEKGARAAARAFYDEGHN